MFEVGQKVVCIADGWDAPHGLNLPKKDSVYTVRELRFGGIAILLVEVRNEVRRVFAGDLEAAFASEGFRPLTDSELQAQRRAVIDRHFSQHLNEPAPEPQTVE